MDLEQRYKVVVLMGGTSSEREVSLVTGRMILSALDPARYDVQGLDTQEFFAKVSSMQPPALPVGSPLKKQEAETLIPSSSEGAMQPTNNETPRHSRPDVVFIALHGKGGEDGTVQGMLELLGIPYTGSGVLASALAMDKAMTKRMLQSANLPTIEGLTLNLPTGKTWSEQIYQETVLPAIQETVGFPVFVKPNAGGSTCGCTLVESAESLFEAVQNARQFDSVVLIERYVQGVEITVGVLDFYDEPLQALPVVEIVPKNAYYDFESKYADGGSEHIIPARISAELSLQAQELAKKCHQLLGCKAMSRTDLIVANNRLYILEVNTIPGMTPTSLLPQAAAAAGIDFATLLDKIIASALQTHKGDAR